LLAFGGGDEVLTKQIYKTGKLSDSANMVRKEETAAGQCVACLTQKQGLKAKTRHAIFCPKGSKQSGGNSSSSLATKNHGPAVGGDASVIAGTPPQSSAATVAPNVATGSGSFHPISDEDDEHLFGGPLPTAEHAHAASCSTDAVSAPVAGASYRAVSEAHPRGAVTARKTTQLTLFGERVPDPNTLSTATAAASEPSSTASAAPSEPQGAPIAASSTITAAPLSTSDRRCATDRCRTRATDRRRTTTDARDDSHAHNSAA
jgi:hypothetical protein